MKKLISAFLAVVMCAALAIPVFATEPAASSNTTEAKTEYEGSIKTPSVRVTVAAANKVILNPYQIEAETKTFLGGDSTEETKIKASVIAPTLLLTNESDVPVVLNVTATGKISEGSGATFNATAPESTEKNRKVYMYAVVTDKGSSSEAPDVSAIPSVIDYSEAGTATQKFAVLKAGDVKMGDVFTMAVPNDEEKGYVTVDIFGQCATTPTTAWTNKDTVTVSFAFTFQPTVAAAASQTNQSGQGGGGNG